MPLDPNKLLVFCGATALLLIVPGPAVLYIVARSVGQGTRAGLISTLGIQCGTLVHVAAASFGVSALLMASATAFAALKYAGAAYLILLGISALRSRGKHGAQPSPERVSSNRRLFTQGVVVNILNPKTALFFFAFLPQFVDPSLGSVTVQLLSLGVIFVVMGTVSDGAYALLAGAVGGWLKERPGFARAQQTFSGLVYIGLGLAAAFSGQNRK